MVQLSGLVERFDYFVVIFLGNKLLAFAKEFVERWDYRCGDRSDAVLPILHGAVMHAKGIGQGRLGELGG